MTIDYPQFDAYDLTPLDHTIPLFDSGHALCFRLSDPEDGLPKLRTAVERLLAIFPFLTGVIAPSTRSDKTGVMEVRPDMHATISTIFTVRRLDHLRLLASPTDGQNDRTYLREIMHDLIPSQIKPPGYNSVIRFQANLVADGIILSVVMNHKAIDGPGLGTLIEALAACCVAGDIPAAEIPGIPTSSLAEAATRASILAAGKTVPKPEGSDGSYAPSDMGSFSNPLLVDYDFCLVSEKLGALKTLCNEALSGTTTVSTDDVASAVVWTCISRIRWHMDEGQGPSCRFGRAINARQRFSPPLSTNYVGNTVLLLNQDRVLPELECPDVPFDVTHAKGSKIVRSISATAKALRDSLNTINSQYTAKIVAGFLHAKDWSGLNIQVPDVTVTSLRGLGVYAQDFGFLGRLENFEILPMVTAEGSCSIKPRRDEDKVWEVRVSLKPEDMASLRENVLFRSLLASS